MLVLNESKAPATILSEGLKHHIDTNKPLTEHLYRAGSRAYFDLFAEARSLYSRGILEFTHEDDVALLTETNLGHFGMFEGKKVPLDFPIELNEEMDLEDELANMEFGMDYDQLGPGEKEWVRDEMDNMSMNEVEEFSTYEQRMVNQIRRALKDGTSIFKLPMKTQDFYRKNKDRLNESDSKYPDFDLNKNIKYQDTSISSGMWRYTGKEQGGKGVYRNLMNDQFLGFSSDDFDFFKKHLGSHFDISESLNENNLLRQAKLSSEEYQRAKRLKDFNADDYEWNSTEDLYVKEKKSKFKKAGEVSGFDMRGIDEVDRYSGFDRNPEDPDSEPFEPTGSVAEFREDLRALFGKFKGDLKNPEFIKGVAQIMVNWKALLRSQLDENKKAKKLNENFEMGDRVKLTPDYEETPGEVFTITQTSGNKYFIADEDGRGWYTYGDQLVMADDEYINEAKKKKAKKKDNRPIGKPMRSSSGGKAYKVYVKDPKTKKVKTVRFGSGGLRAKINDSKARAAFAARHKCSQKKDRTKAGYWSCRLPRYAKLLGLKSSFSGFW
jgi:hypothetical protein